MKTTTTLPVGSVDLLSADGPHIRVRLVKFRKFDLPKFAGKNDDGWAVERWVAHMEKLFPDLRIDEQDKIPLATYCLENEAYN